MFSKSDPSGPRRVARKLRARTWRPSGPGCRGAVPARRRRCRAARRKKRIERKIADLFEHRYLFVRHHRATSQRKTLARITRGQPQLRTLRGLMEEVYRLFDRRCRGGLALAKLALLRARCGGCPVREVLKKLFLQQAWRKALGVQPMKSSWERRRTPWSVEPSIPEDTERCIGCGPCRSSSSDAPGPAPGTTSPKPIRNDQDPPQGAGGMILWPGILATVSTFRSFSPLPETSTNTYFIDARAVQRPRGGGLRRVGRGRRGR